MNEDNKICILNFECYIKPERILDFLKTFEFTKTVYHASDNSWHVQGRIERYDIGYNVSMLGECIVKDRPNRITRTIRIEEGPDDIIF